MTLVDTSVWIDHFRNTNAKLVELLQNFEVLIHPMVLGEIACGNLQNRDELLTLLGQLPVAEEAAQSEIFTFIENNRLYGKGLGYVDIALLVSALISRVELFTLDNRLQKAWEKLRKKMV
ncbi:MAG: PIN domain-containing protein [Leptospirales bacterium]